MEKESQKLDLTFEMFGLNPENPSDKLLIDSAHGDPLLAGLMAAKEDLLDAKNDPTNNYGERLPQVLKFLASDIQRRQQELGIE